MEVLIPILGVFLGGPLVLVIVLASITSRVERDRKARVGQWAVANGWRFQERTYAPWTNRLVGNELLAYAPAGVFKDPNLIPGYAGPLMHVADLLGPVSFCGPSDR
ncbi:hypothetical protein ACWCW7_15820 [Nocardia tengchongensis]